MTVGSLVGDLSETRSCAAKGSRSCANDSLHMVEDMMSLIQNHLTPFCDEGNSCNWVFFMLVHFK